MRIKTLGAALLALLPLMAAAQFDFGTGGGSQGPTEAWKQFTLNPKTRLKLDFRNANVDMVLAIYSKSSGINIVKDPALTGSITVTSAAAVSLNDAFEILNATLGLKGFEMRKEGNLLVIRQRSQRRDENTGRGPFGDMSAEQVMNMFSGSRGELKVYQLQYASASQIARVVNEVFAQSTDPLMDMLNMMMGGGTVPGMPQNIQFQPGGGGNRFQGAGGGAGGGGRNNVGGQFGGGGGQNFRQGLRGGGFGRNQSLVRASADDFSNSVIINAPSRDHIQIAELIKQIDKESDAPLQPKVYRLQFAIADDIAPAIQNVLIANAPKGRGGAGQQNIPFEQRIQQAFRFGSAQTAFGQVVTDARTNSLIVSATEDNHKVVDKVIKELDTEVKMESSAFVVPLSNARADDVSALLNQAFGSRTTNQNRNRNVGTRTTTNNQNSQPNRNNNNQGGGTPRVGGGYQSNNNVQGNELMLDLQDPEANAGDLYTSIDIAQGGIFQLGQPRPATGGGTTLQGRDAQGRIVNTRDLTNQITIIPDVNTNSLIVVTSPDNVDLVRQILEQIDRIPEQVLIETMIIEATLDNSTKFGVEWTYTQNNAFGKTGQTATSEGNFGLAGATPALQGFRYTLTGGNLEAFINALKSDNKFQVLSTPRIFTSNNAQAQINISQRVPYVLSSREDPNGNLTFTYAFQDVGIVLTVTPRITANGFVTMDIVQTANDLQGFTDFNAPIINTREADTTVTVKDGETIILGGIMRSTVSAKVKKIPLLGDIPILGEIFRSTDKQNIKTELLVFLTPRVVRNPDEAQRLREEQQKRLSKESQNAVQKNVPPVKPPQKEPPPIIPPQKTTGGGGF